VQYAGLVKAAVEEGAREATAAGETMATDKGMAMILDRLSVTFGLEILKVVPGYVSTEVDARLRYMLICSPCLAPRMSHVLVCVHQF